VSDPTLPFATKHLPERHDAVAPDGSRIRVLARTGGASMAHGTLDPGEVSRTCMHPAIDEIWFVLAGQAEIWRKRDDREGDAGEEDIYPGTSLTIPARTRFQFRTVGAEPFRFIMCTMPPWREGDDSQWVSVPDHWEPILGPDR
jgi:mannose-6-phosphate isomerase-like protein (cupin superfamily)